MHDLRDYNTLTPKQITAAIGQLNHNTAPKILTQLALRTTQSHPFGNNRASAKALRLLRRVKKAHKAGCIPLELTVIGCRIDRDWHSADRYVYDERLLAQGCWPRAGSNTTPTRMHGISASGLTLRSWRPSPTPRGTPVM